LSKRLHPPEWQRLALADAIRQLWQISGIPQRFEASLDLDELPQEPDLEVKTLVYRAMQEALSNLLRHSGATRVAVSLKLTDGILTLTVEDNGVGFDVERLSRQPAGIASGIGLRSIREQAEALDARMHVQSGASGTTLRISVAVRAAEASQDRAKGT
jgi:two-component system NarL family sensor kinase